MEKRVRKYRVVIGEYSFVIRGLTNGEYKDLSRKYSKIPDRFQLEACKLAVQEPSEFNFSEAQAGLIEKLFDEILNSSALKQGEGTRFENFVQEATDWLTSEDGRMEAIALATIPGLTLDILEESDPPIRIKYLWLGLFNCNNFFGIPHEAILNPEEYAEKNNKKNKGRRISSQ
jgi:hypothetical protein